MKDKTNGKLIWKSQEEQKKELKERIKNWVEGNSKDGFIKSAEGKFKYRGIYYLIKVLRYYNHTNKFTTLGRDRISDSHSNVEYPEETKPIIDLIPYDYNFEFLYHDTLHIWNDNQTSEQQIDVCHDLAKEDIDSLLDGEISKKIKEEIKNLKKVKNKLEKEIQKLLGERLK